MCQTCISCGKCQGEVRPASPAGYCPMCGTQNDAATDWCAGCGAPLPKPAGVGKGDNLSIPPLKGFEAERGL